MYEPYPIVSPRGSRHGPRRSYSRPLNDLYVQESGVGLVDDLRLETLTLGRYP